MVLSCEVRYAHACLNLASRLLDYYRWIYGMPILGLLPTGYEDQGRSRFYSVLNLLANLVRPIVIVNASVRTSGHAAACCRTDVQDKSNWWMSIHLFYNFVLYKMSSLHCVGLLRTYVLGCVALRAFRYSLRCVACLLMSLRIVLRCVRCVACVLWKPGFRCQQVRASRLALRAY